jgi:hypothetical protein
MLLNDRWARGDIDRAGSVALRSGEAAGATTIESMQAAIAAGGKPGKRVWVLTDRVWLGDVDLPPSATVGLTDAQIADAAAYEAEATGGLTPWNAVTAVSRVRVQDADDRFLTAQIARGDVLELAKCLSRRGATLAGVLHPAGLPLDISGQQNAESADSWSRIEFWRDETVVVRASRDRTDVHPTGLPPTADWRRGVRGVMQAAGMDPASDGSPGLLLGPGAKPAGGPQLESDHHDAAPRWADPRSGTMSSDDRVLDLASDDALKQFVEAWARVLSQGQPAVPVLRKPKAPAGPVPQVLVGVVALALALGLVYLQYSTRQAELAELRDAATHVQSDQAELVKLRKTAQDLTREIRTKTQELDRQRAAALAEARRAQNARRTIVDLRPRLALLLTTLIDATADPALEGRFAIEAIRPQSPTHVIEGVATSSLAASVLARRLAETLDGSWHVHPAEVTPVTRGETVAWRFTLLVEPTGAHMAGRNEDRTTGLGGQR